jgi:hypothetical protein
VANRGSVTKKGKVWIWIGMLWEVVWAWTGLLCPIPTPQPLFPTSPFPGPGVEAEMKEYMTGGLIYILPPALAAML